VDFWIPAFAGMTKRGIQGVTMRRRKSASWEPKGWALASDVAFWIPAFAGIQCDGKQKFNAGKSGNWEERP
jgi:hypothetical protein